VGRVHGFAGTPRILEALDRSPKGQAYPTRTRQTDDDGKHDVVRTFFVDFQAPVAEELFLPLK
jgi:hypothetical protein